MSLETTFADIIARLRQGQFPDEQAISQGIVLHVLQELSWDIYDTTLVWPEFQIGEGRADFALGHPPSKFAETLRRHLARARFESGEALDAAPNEYHRRKRRAPARDAIPGAWRKLVERGNDDLVDMLASERW
jgi:hypothetical protein